MPRFELGLPVPKTGVLAITLHLNKAVRPIKWTRKIVWAHCTPTNANIVKYLHYE